MKAIAKSLFVAGMIAFAGAALAAQDGASMAATPKAAKTNQAGNSQTAPRGKSFSALDKDKDGQLSREEFLAAGVPSPHERFMNCDADSSFSLSPEEYAACMKK